MSNQITPVIHLHKGDLPDGLDFGDAVAVDSETMGLRIHRDRLCVVQLSAGDGVCHLVQLEKGKYDAPNLCALMADASVQKIFHFARFDVAAIEFWLGTRVQNLFCTKVASKLVRTFTDRQGLKNLCHDFLGVEISKQQQTSDWGAPVLTEAQQQYAASDVLYLHKLRDELIVRLKREDRMDLAQRIFDFLPTQGELDILLFDDPNILDH